MTKKRCALEDEMLMRISPRQELLKSHELNQITDTWKSLRERIIFSEEVELFLVLNCECYFNIFLTDIVIERCSRKYALPEILKSQQ